MSISKARARKIAKRILRENRKGRSWRVISREDYPTVKPGTLNRFAKEKGAYIPVDEDILVALGLKKPRVKRPPKQSDDPAWMTDLIEGKKMRKRAIRTMVKQTNDAITCLRVRTGRSEGATMTEFCNNYQAKAYHKECKKGIAYASFGGARELPCWNEKIGGCDLAEYPTPEQIAEREARILQFMDGMRKFTVHETDICFHCGKQVTSLRQVGRCVYGSCGCRMWQGRIPKEWR